MAKRTSIYIPNYLWPYVNMAVDIDYPDIPGPVSRLWCLFAHRVKNSDIPHDLKEAAIEAFAKRVKQKTWGPLTSVVGVDEALVDAIDVISQMELGCQRESRSRRIRIFLIHYVLTHPALTDNQKKGLAHILLQKSKRRSGSGFPVELKHLLHENDWAL